MINTTKYSDQNNNDGQKKIIISTSAVVVQHEELAMNFMKTLMILSQNYVHWHQIYL